MNQERMVWNEDLATKLETQWKADPNLRHKFLLKKTADLIPEDCKEVLDVGCGFGDLWPFLESKGMTPEQYCGVDPSRAMLRRARERFPFLDFQEGDVFKSLPASSFDCVVSCSLLVHLQDQETAIRNMWNHARRVLIGNFVVSEVVIESHIGTDGELIRHVPRTYISDILCSLGGADYIEWHRLGDATYFFRVWRKCV